MINKVSLKKFDLDGKPIYFPGQTIVNNFVDPKLNELLKEISDNFKTLSFANKFAYLPKNSYHMTLCDLIVFNNLKEDNKYPAEIKALESLEETDYYIINKLKDLEYPKDVKITIDYIAENKVYIKGYHEEDLEKLKAFRKKTLEFLKIKYNEDYKFHISLNYSLYHLTDEENKELNELLVRLNDQYKDKFPIITLDNIILAFYNDMMNFTDYKKGRKKY